MRSDAWVLGLVLGCAVGAFGCGRREPITARDADPTACPCAAAVETLSAPVEAVEPTTTVAARPGTRLQQTVSLGYAGDKPLTQVPTRREWWGDRDRGPAAYGGYAYGYGGRGAQRGGHAAATGAAGQGSGAAPVQHGMGMRFGGGPQASAPSPPAGHAPR